MQNSSIIKTFGNSYTPRKWQEWVHAKSKRFNVFVCHRRAGKSILAIAELRDRALRNTKRNPVYVYIGPTYGQVKKLAWGYVKEFFSILPNVQFKEGELCVIIPRPEYEDCITIYLVSAENPDSLRGLYLDGVVVDEFADQSPIIWSLTLRPALADRGGWAIFIGTPKGTDHFKEIYDLGTKLMEQGEDWFTCKLTVEHTNAIDPHELEDAKQTMTSDEIAQEFFCDFNAALTGAYFSDLLLDAEEKGRICDLPYNPAYAVITAWDLGISDSTAIWFIQKIPGEQYYHVIDYFEMNGKGIDTYIQELQKKGYYYSKYLMPHDAKQREFSTGKSRMDTFAKKGIRDYEIVPKVGMKSDAINAVREILPLCKFDKNRCASGLSALRSYQREYDNKKKMYHDRPRHDWTSHSSDSFQTFARGVRPDHFVFRGEEFNKSLPTTAILEYTEY